MADDVHNFEKPSQTLPPELASSGRRCLSLAAEDTSAIAEKVLSVVCRPMRLDGNAMSVSASVGTAVYPDDAGNAESLMRNVDQAMYRAKEDGGARHQSYSDARASARGGAA
jgi:GGDEF domain-containing protein